MKNNVSKLGLLVFHFGHVRVRIPVYTHAHLCSTLSNFLMINVELAVLLLDTKIYEAEEENHHSC